MAMWFVHALNAALLGLLIWLAVQFPESEAAFWLAIAGAITALGLYALARMEKTRKHVVLSKEILMMPEDERRKLLQRLNPLIYLFTALLLILMAWVSFAGQGTLGLSGDQALILGAVLFLGIKPLFVWGGYTWFTHHANRHIRADRARRAAVPEDARRDQPLFYIEGVGEEDPLPGMRPLPRTAFRLIHGINIALIAVLVGAVFLITDQWPITLIFALMGLSGAALLYLVAQIDNLSSWVGMPLKHHILALPAEEQEAIFQRYDIYPPSTAALTLLMLAWYSVGSLITDAAAAWDWVIFAFLMLLLLLGTAVWYRWVFSYAHDRIRAYEKVYCEGEAVEGEPAAR